MFESFHRPEGRDDVQTLTERFKAFVAASEFPCVGAKSALGKDQMTIIEAGDIRCPRDDGSIYDALAAFTTDFKTDPSLFHAFVVLFAAPDIMSEIAFEQALWARVQALHILDVTHGFDWDPRVSADVDSPEFSLSFGGEAFYLVGLHPGASRPARRFFTPALVFNAHAQFAQLRADGRYETLRERIIARDVAIAGSANPMLARHGEASEARQYSGRVVDDSWQCPFKPTGKPA
jgi:FPC/CPF motif-containing protein YcgG